MNDEIFAHNSLCLLHFKYFLIIRLAKLSNSCWIKISSPLCLIGLVSILSLPYLALQLFVLVTVFRLYMQESYNTWGIMRLHHGRLSSKVSLPHLLQRIDSILKWRLFELPVRSYQTQYYIVLAMLLHTWKHGIIKTLKFSYSYDWLRLHISMYP